MCEVPDPLEPLPTCDKVDVGAAHISPTAASTGLLPRFHAMSWTQAMGHCITHVGSQLFSILMRTIDPDTPFK